VVSAVTLCDVAPRDGLQNHATILEPGVHLDALIGVSMWLEKVLGHELEGQVYRACTFAPIVG